MFIFRKQTAAVAFLQSAYLFFPLSAQAEVNNFHYDKGAVAGKKGMFGASIELDINCNLVRSNPPRLIEAPSHGAVVFSRSIDYPLFNRDNPHYKCTNKKYPSTRIFYNSEPDYKGKDHFVIEDISSLGDVNISSFDVDVQ